MRVPVVRLFASSAAFGLVAAAILTACGSGNSVTGPSGLPSCGTATQLSVSPVPVSSITEISPLGNLAPPSHTFPSDHIYFYSQPDINIGGSVSAPVVSPGTIHVTTLTLSKRTGNGPEFDDYELEFYPCSGLRMYFGHLTTLASSFSALVGSLASSCDTPYMTGGYTFQQCHKSVDVTLNPGDDIGTAHGPGQGALDFGAIDQSVTVPFVDPGRTSGVDQVHTACPLDYFTAGVRATLQSLLAVNGMHRTIEPRCGTIAQDVANTAQGRWFFDATTNDDHHLALVHTNWDPTIGAFSVGTQLAGAFPGLYLFTPASSGRVNRDFNQVTADGQIYCYQVTGSAQATILIQLETTSRLRIQLNNATSCGDPATWSFGSNSVTYNR